MNCRLHVVFLAFLLSCIQGCASPPAANTTNASRDLAPRAAAVTPVPVMPRVFTEAAVASSDPLAQVFLTNPAFFQGWSWAAPLDDQIKDAVAYLRTMPPGHRGACFGGWFFYPLTNIQYPTEVFAGLPPADPVRDFQQGKICNVEWETARLAKIAKAFADASIVLDFAYFDYEGYWNVWGYPKEDVMAKIVADPLARKFFTPALLAATPEGKVPAFGDPLWRAYIYAMTDYCDNMVKKAMTKALTDSGLAARCGTIVNFEGRRTGAFPIYENGWKHTLNNTIDSKGTSCVAAYFPSGWAFRYPPVPLSKDESWNLLIDALNHARSLGGAGPVVPVLETCQWTPEREWITECYVQHCLRAGVSMFDLFNPKGCQEEDQEAKLAAIFARHFREANPTRLVLPEIPLDADAITTNGCTITYGQFMSVVNVYRASGTKAVPPRPSTLTPKR